MSATPRTDAMLGNPEYCVIKFARELEDENSKLRDEIEKVSKYLREHWHDEYAESLEIILHANAPSDRMAGSNEGGPK